MSEVMNVPEGWEVKPLIKCATITNSNVDKKYLLDEIEVKLCNYMDVYSKREIENSTDFMIATATDLEIKKFSLLKDDVIITKDSESPDDIGIPTYIKEDLPNVLCGYHLTLIRPKKNCDGKYLSLLLQDNVYKKYFGAIASGSTRFALSLGAISNSPISIPPIKEQQKIAKILSTLDKTIESTAKLIDKEKNIKKGLMHDLLTNGIDKNNKIRTPQTHQYKQSELGLIPEEWEIKSLGSISKTFAGGTPNRENNSYYNGNIPWVKSGEVNQSKIEKTEEFITTEGLKNSSAKMIVKNTILVAMYGATAGQIAILEINASSNQAVLAVPLVNDEIYFLLYMMNFHMPKLLFQAQGSGQPNLSKQLVDRMLITIPSQPEQKQIAKILTTQDKKIETEEATLAKLKELKKGLMNDLLSGNVRVKA